MTEPELQVEAIAVLLREQRSEFALELDAIRNGPHAVRYPAPQVHTHHEFTIPAQPPAEVRVENTVSPTPIQASFTAPEVHVAAPTVENHVKVMPADQTPLIAALDRMSEAMMAQADAFAALMTALTNRPKRTVSATLSDGTELIGEVG